MTDPQRRWTHRALRYLLAVVLLVAVLGAPGLDWGSGKLRHPSQFAKNIRTYQIVPERLVFPMAVYVPWLELTLGVVLLAGFWAREALAVVLMLFDVFLIANLAALVRGIEVDCGCFGADYHGSAGQEAVIVLALMLATVAALLTLPARPTNAKADEPRPDASSPPSP